VKSTDRRIYKLKVYYLSGVRYYYRDGGPDLSRDIAARVKITIVWLSTDLQGYI
jgi:hypothetical protein